MIDFYTIIKDRVQGKAELGQRRSSKWPKARDDHKEAHPACEVCGSTKKVEVHHVVPFSIAPDLELDPENFASLCENKKYGINCHLLIGHLGNYQRVNLNCKIDIMVWHEKIRGHKK